MQKEKVRVYILARELNIDTTDLLRLCKQAGYDVKNQLSSLEPEQQAKLQEMVKKGTKPAAAPAPAKPVTKVITPEQRVVPNLAPRVPKREDAPRAVPVEEPPAPEPAAPVEMPTVAEAAPEPAAPVAPKPVVPIIKDRVPTIPTTRTSTPEPAAPKPSAPTAAPSTPAAPPPTVTAPVAPTPAAPTPAKPPVRPALVPSKPPSLAPAAKDTGTGKPPERRPEPRRPIPAPSSPFQHLKPIAPPSLKQQPKLPEKPKEKTQTPIAIMTKEHLDQGIRRAEDLLRPQQQTAVVEAEEDEEAKKDKKRVIPGREERQKKRNIRKEERQVAQAKVAVLGIHDGKVEYKDEEELRARRSPHRIKMKHKQVIKQRPTSLVLEGPLTVRTLSEELGIRSVELIFKMKEHGVNANLTINSVIDDDVAELVATNFGCDLKVEKPRSEEEKYLDTLNDADTPEDLVLRAPIVTVMGHVDHGKTSLLDKIRQSNIVDTEAGGITQVLRAWRVEHGGRPVTFLDTPGHEAFTQMRARGAQVTDVAVIVVAADDGVMPQTEEAINHAKAAGVSLVIAINKIDMPSANINRTRQQLYSLGVLPDNMGGDTPFVETSAATGKGIDELLDQLAVVAELKELKANPKKHARGTCLEAMLSEGEGVRATVLVRDGTLRKGDVVLCGAAHGRVRQMYNDMGKPIDEAGPSVPVRITGLDEVPNAGDPFQVVPDLNIAASVAETRGQKMRETSVTKRQPLTLERLTETKIQELKVILKADFRGSIEAIKKELDKLQHAEVRVRLLEAGIGAITENDVWLALASPEDTMIVGFNAVPDDRALALAEDRGVQIREYNIIYNLTNDIRSALEGKLKPREEVVHLGRAIVRDTFKISRVGTIAGCYVTQGNIKRNAKIRVIREGVVIYPPPDRSAGLESLKRFKDDVGEVREGFECGIKVAGYDDIKVGDVIEAFRVEHVQRTLE